MPCSLSLPLSVSPPLCLICLAATASHVPQKLGNNPERDMRVIMRVTLSRVQSPTLPHEACLSKCLHTFTFFLPHTHTYRGRYSALPLPHYECVAPFRNMLPACCLQNSQEKFLDSSNMGNVPPSYSFPAPPLPLSSTCSVFENALNFCPQLLCVPSFYRQSHPVSQSFSLSSSQSFSQLGWQRS